MPLRMDTHMTETEFQRLVVQLAKLRGWMIYHVHDSRKVDWASDQGFPDWVFLRERVFYAELKRERTDRGKLSNAQKKWLSTLKDAGQEVYVWRPSDWDTIARTLARPVAL